MLEKETAKEGGSSFKSEKLDKVLRNKENEVLDYQVASTSGAIKLNYKTQRDLVVEFFKVLSLAHECVPETVTKADGTKMTFYQGPSPDEVTLVDFAKLQGFDFKETSDVKITIELNQWVSPAQDVAYQVFRKMEFNSDRKRMSIVIRDPADGHYKMFTKGADSIIKDRLDPKQVSEKMMEGVDDFLMRASVKGLRTLLMAMRVIDENEFKAFFGEIAEAEKDVMNRDKILAQIYDRFERGLVLLGATAVEDRLQDNVPETINDLQEAGIKIWMLTGDKLETAENIGYSCRLLQKDMVVWRISNKEEVDKICSLATVEENNRLIML